MVGLRGGYSLVVSMGRCGGKILLVFVMEVVQCWEINFLTTYALESVKVLTPCFGRIGG